jgi:hypothetical protein
MGLLLACWFRPAFAGLGDEPSMTLPEHGADSLAVGQDSTTVEGGSTTPSIPYAPWLVNGLIVDAGDRSSIPEPAEQPVSGYYDFLDKTFFHSVAQFFDVPRQFRRVASAPKEAEDVNAFDEAPNSTWFENRIFFFPPTAEQVRRGSNLGEGPDPKGNWEVVRGKTQGVTPGFNIKDSQGDVYVIKFDPPEWPEMATGAEAISTRIFHLAGYHCPENYLVSLDLDHITVSPKAQFIDSLGARRPMTREDVIGLLAPLPRQPDGTIRALASKFIAGKIKGHFDYSGWRKDDPNDLVKHEHRRSLRGMRAIAAWTLHNDCRSLNNLESYVTDDQGKQYLMHYLIDFGATLGSASLFPNLDYEGHQYIFDGDEIGTQLVTLGLDRRPFEGQPMVISPATGYFESEIFDADDWKPNYPNPAFQNATHRDLYWGAKIVMSFTDEIIDQLVQEAHYSRREDAEHMVQVLRERRDKVGREWFAKVNPLDRFRISNEGETVGGGASGAGMHEMLRFDDLAVTGKLADAGTTRYRYRIEPPLDDAGENDEWQETTTPAVSLGLNAGSAAAHEPGVHEVRIETRRGEEGFGPAVRIQLEHDGGPTRIVAIRR